MSRKKEYEEKEKHGTAQFPVGLHKLEYPADTDVMFYVHWHQEFEFLVLTEGKVLFTIEDSPFVFTTGPDNCGSARRFRALRPPRS